MQEDNIFDFKDIDLKILVSDYLKNIWVVILMTLSVYLAFCSFERVAFVPLYTSTTTFAISEKGNGSAYWNLKLTENMTEVFGEVFKSDVLKEVVAEEIGVDQLDVTIDTEIIPDTNLLKVHVTAKSPEEAFRSLNSIIDNYTLVSDYLFGNAVLDVIKSPEVPLLPSNTFLDPYKRKLAILGVAVLISAFICGVSIFRDTIKTKSSAKRKLDGKLIGTVTHEKKNKTKRFGHKTSILITNPLASYNFVDGCQSLSARIAYHMAKRNQKIIMITSAGENEGKSTVAANIALGLAARKKKVLLVDCDFRKPALYKVFDIESREFQDFSRYLKAKEINGSTEYEFYEKNDVKMALTRYSHQSPQKILTSKYMVDFFHQAKEEFDFIIVDTAPMMATSDAEALGKIVDTALLVIRQDYIYTGDLNDCMDVLRQLPSECMGYALNNFDA